MTKEEEAYKLFWKFVKKSMEEVPLYDHLSKEEFDKYKTGIILPEIGRIACTYDKYENIWKGKDKKYYKTKKTDYNGREESKEN